MGKQDSESAQKKFLPSKILFGEKIGTVKIEEFAL